MWQWWWVVSTWDVAVVVITSQGTAPWGLLGVRTAEVLPIRCSSRGFTWERRGMCTPPPWPTQHLPRGLRRVGPEGATGGTWLSLPASPQLSHTDIQFWNSRQSLEGLSVRSVFFGVFQSFVVLLYILDNETNFVVQVSVFIGVLIDLWKITKVMDVRVRPGCHAVLGAIRGGGGCPVSQTLELALGVSQCLPHSQDQGGFHTRGFFGSHGAGELGTVRKDRHEGRDPAWQPTTASVPVCSWTGSTRWQDSFPAQRSKTSPHTSSPQPKCMMT